MNVNDLVFSPEETDEEELDHMARLLRDAADRLEAVMNLNVYTVGKKGFRMAYEVPQFEAYRIVEAVFKTLEYRLDGFAHDVPPADELFEEAKADATAK